jgi:hypothetical protein
MNDIMVDLETMGKVADSAIASIGAVECNLITGETREEFYKVVDLNNQPNLTINPNTLYWWLKRSDAARLGLVVEGRLSLKETCEALHRWVSYLDAPNENIRLWGRKHSNYREGTHHNALADAKHQIKYCSDILKELGVKELY